MDYFPDPEPWNYEADFAAKKRNKLICPKVRVHKESQRNSQWREVKVGSGWTLYLISEGEALDGRTEDLRSHFRILLRGVLHSQIFIIVCVKKQGTDPFLSFKPNFVQSERDQEDVTLTISVDNLIDLVRVVWVLGVILYHLEAHGQVVESAAEVGFPPCLVVGELVDFATCYGPCLSTRI